MGCCNKKPNRESLLDIDKNLKNQSIFDNSYTSNLYPIKQQKITKDDFEQIKLIGKGSFGKVLLVRKKLNQKLYAMKVLEKSLIKNQGQEVHTKTERTLLEKIDHPFIAKLHYAFQSTERLYIITEFMQGGDYFYLLRRERRFSEEMTKFYIGEIVLALEYLHNSDCIYRDLKPENILLGKDGHVKITDFGLSKYFYTKKEKDHKAYTICGTADYLAPEVMRGKGYDKTVDWWSLGVLIFESLSGYSPFRVDRGQTYDFKDYLDKLNLDSFYYWSSEAKNIIIELLQIEPKKRLGSGVQGSSNIKKHDFFKDINWDDLLNKRIKPPYIPSVKYDEDLSNFEKIFTEENIDSRNDIYLNDNRYEGFTYIKPNSLINN